MARFNSRALMAPLPSPVSVSKPSLGKGAAVTRLPTPADPQSLDRFVRVGASQNRGGLVGGRQNGPKVSERVRYFESLARSNGFRPAPFVPGPELRRGHVKTMVARYEAISGGAAALIPPPRVRSISTQAESPKSALSLLWGRAKSKLAGTVSWARGELKAFLEPFTLIPGLFSANRIKRSQAQDAGVEISGRVFRAVRTCADLSSNVVQWIAGSAVVYFDLIPLGWLTAALSGLYGAANTVEAVNVSKRLKRLKQVSLKSETLKPTRDFARAQLQRRVRLKATAATGAFVTMVGGLICLGTMNMWNPAGWALMGGALAVTGVWLVWKVGAWIFARVKGLQRMPERIEGHVREIFDALESERGDLKADAVAVLEALGVKVDTDTVKADLKNRKRMITLVSVRLKGADDFFI